MLSFMDLCTIDQELAFCWYQSEKMFAFKNIVRKIYLALRQIKEMHVLLDSQTNFGELMLSFLMEW